MKMIPVLKLLNYEPGPFVRDYVSPFLATLGRAIDILRDHGYVRVIDGVKMVYIPAENDRACPEYSEWRSAVLNRDGNLCKECGLGENIEAHHIRPFFLYYEERFKPENGIVLCNICHAGKHQQGWKNMAINEFITI